MRKWVQVFRHVSADDQKFRIAGYYQMSKQEEKEQQILDSINLQVVSSFLNTYGWPATKEIGLIGQRAISMVIQHAPLNVQEKYYPELIKTFKRDSLLRETVALLEDRINMKRKRPQMYGTQVVRYHDKYVLFPVYQVDSLEERRKALGLKISMSEYLKLFNINWSVNDYKKQLPELKRNFRVSDSLGVHY